MRFFHTYRLEIGIFVVAVLLRVLYLGSALQAQGDFMTTIEGSDYYTVVSENLVAGNGYSADLSVPYTPWAFRPPVFPYFLATLHELGGSYALPLGVEIVLGALIPILGMYLARYIVDSRKIPIIVGWLLAFEPSAILYSTEFYSETVFIFIFLLSLLFLFHYFKRGDPRLLWLSAIVLGLATLTRPTMQYFSIVIAAIVWWVMRHHNRDTILKHAGIYLALFALTLAPWYARNWIQFHEFGFTSQEGTTLYAVTVPSVLSIANHTSFGVEFDKLKDKGVKGPNLATMAQSKEYFKLAVPILVSHPKELTLVSLNTGLSYFIHDGMYDVLRQLNIRPDTTLGGPAIYLLIKNPVALAGFVVHFLPTPFGLILIARVLWILVFLFFLYGAWRYFTGEPTPAGVTSFACVLYLLLMTLPVGLTVNARHHLPINTFLFVFALMGAAILWDKLHKIKTRWY